MYISKEKIWAGHLAHLKFGLGQQHKAEFRWHFNSLSYGRQNTRV